MQEVFDLSFSAENIFPTVVLLMTALYWIVFLLGFLDLDFLDFDAGGKDVQIDAGGDADMDGPGGKDFGSTMFDFMNLTQVPFMVVFSFFAVFFWAGSVIGNHYLAGHHTGLVIAVLIGAILASLLVTKLITQPLRRVFRKLNDFEGKLDLRGKTCVLLMGLNGTMIGQADLVHGTKHLLINVRSVSGAPIANGSRCLVVAEDDEREDTFLVEAIEDATS
jgi:Protein of unknown function (DUF1449)